MNSPVENPETPPVEWSLWFRQTARNPWVIVGRGKTLDAVVALVGCGGRRNGDWFPLVAGKHPDECGAPDRPRKRPKLATATPSLFAAG